MLNERTQRICFTLGESQFLQAGWNVPRQAQQGAQVGQDGVVHHDSCIGEACHPIDLDWHTKMSVNRGDTLTIIAKADGNVPLTPAMKQKLEALMNLRAEYLEQLEHL